MMSEMLAGGQILSQFLHNQEPRASNGQEPRHATRLADVAVAALSLAVAAAAQRAAATRTAPSHIRLRVPGACACGKGPASAITVRQAARSDPGLCP